LLALACALIAASNRLFDWDYWQHLAVGRAIWRLHEIPRVHLWTWPSYGKPDLLPSWLFRALLWPFWAAGGAMGLYAWRWLVTAIVGAIAWRIAHRLGARGLAPIAVILVSLLVFRQRTQLRPETLVAIWIGLHLWILETRRQGGPDRTPWLILTSWLWVNTHISYHFGLALIAIHWLDAVSGGGTRARDGVTPRRGAVRLAWVGIAALAVSFANPFGWRALWQPFDYFLHERHLPIYQSIGELQPAWMMWDLNWRNGYPLLLVGWPLLLLWRARRSGLDRVELLTCVLFTWLGLSATRFVSFHALIAAPYVARDLAEWIASRRMSARLPAPARLAVAAGFCVALTVLELSGPLGGPALRIDLAHYPVRACDFMAEHGVRGRGFNQFYIGGYQMFRFWPERDRLPFMDIHQTGSVWDRTYYMRAQAERASWDTLDARYRFDYVLLGNQHPPGETLSETLDSDSRWALVFTDDAASVLVRRDGPLAAVAERYAYRKIGTGRAWLERARGECREDSDSCAVVIAELERVIASSPYDSQAHSVLANAMLLFGRYQEAGRHLEAALSVDPWTPRAHERLGLVALAEGRPRDALRAFELERRVNRNSQGLDLRMGQAWRRLGETARAREAFQHELARNPDSQEARDSLAALDRAAPR
jgi:hypothetical protein